MKINLVARRVIPLPEKEIHAIALKIRSAIEDPKSLAGLGQIFCTFAHSFVDLKDVKGNSVDFIQFQLMSWTGTYALTDKKKKLIQLNIGGQFIHDKILDSFFNFIEALISHEITHLVDCISQKELNSLQKAKEKLQLQPEEFLKDYLNIPYEIRAYTRQICEDLRFSGIHNPTKLQEDIEKSNTYCGIKKYLSEKSKKIIYQRVYTYLEENGMKPIAIHYPPTFDEENNWLIKPSNISQEIHDGILTLLKEVKT